MRIIRLAEFLVMKYKLAISAAELESSLRKKISMLWMYANKNYNILKICSDSGASKPTNANERKAVAGYVFCKDLLAIIDYLKANDSEISLGELREGLAHLLDLIESNKDIRFNANGKPDPEAQESNVQFQHVSELIFQLIPIKTKYDIKLRNDQFSKAKTGLSRILSVAIDMADDIKKLEALVPEKFDYKNITDIDTNQELPRRFKPQRAPLSEYDIVDFIRQHGDDYGLSSKEDWGTIFRDNLELKEKMTTVINTINRASKDKNGRPIWEPKDAAEMKLIISEILRDVEESKSTNAHLFEDSE